MELAQPTCISKHISRPLFSSHYLCDTFLDHCMWRFPIKVVLISHSIIQYFSIVPTSIYLIFFAPFMSLAFLGIATAISVILLMQYRISEHFAYLAKPFVDMLSLGEVICYHSYGQSQLRRVGPSPVIYVATCHAFPRPPLATSLKTKTLIGRPLHNSITVLLFFPVIVSNPNSARFIYQPN